MWIVTARSPGALVGRGATEEDAWIEIVDKWKGWNILTYSRKSPLRAAAKRTLEAAGYRARLEK